MVHRVQPIWQSSPLATLIQDLLESALPGAEEYGPDTVGLVGDGMKGGERRLGVADDKTVVYRQEDGAWVADMSAVAGCYALMPTRQVVATKLGFARRRQTGSHERWNHLGEPE